MINNLPNDWLNIYLLNNCFNDKNKKHFGLKYNNTWFVITHSSTGSATIVPKSCLIGFNILDTRTNYIKLVNNSAPNPIRKTKKKIHYSILANYSIL